MTTPDSGLSAALLQMTQFGERIALLDDREARNFRHVESTLAEISGTLANLKMAVDGQGEVLKSLEGLSESVTRLAAQVAGLLPPAEDEPGRGYTPRPPVHWWKLNAGARQKEVDHLDAWVEQIYRPWYGHLAVGLGSCWQQHPAALVGLEILSELHSTLNFQPKRTPGLLTSQAEFQVRILPAMAEQFRVETSRCTHRQAAANGSRWAGAR
jgi:hypothetical protein